MFVPKNTRIFLALALLLLSWLMLFKFITFMVDLSLPYHISWYDYWGWPADSPPVDSWQRNLAYFLASPTGSVLPALSFVLISAGLLGAIFSSNPGLRVQSMKFSLIYTVTSIISIPVTFMAIYVSLTYFSERLTGWPLTVVACWLPLIVGLIGLLVMQGYVIPVKLIRISQNSYREGSV